MSAVTTSFFVDVRRGDLAAVKRTLGRQPGVLHSRSGPDQRTPLHVAAEVGNHLMLRTLLQHGAGYAVPDAAGEVPLMLAARQGHLAVVRELLADAGRRSCLKSLSKDGSTALHVAAAAGQAEVVQLMLDAGARTDARDRAGRTPLDACPGDQPVLARMLQHGRAPVGSRSPSVIGQNKSPSRSPIAKSPHPGASPTGAPKARSSGSPQPRGARSKPSSRATSPDAARAGAAEGAAPAPKPEAAAECDASGAGLAVVPRSLEVELEALPEQAQQQQPQQKQQPAAQQVQPQKGAHWREDQECAAQQRRQPQQQAPQQQASAQQHAAAQAAPDPQAGHMRLGLLGQQGPLRQHQQQRAEEEQAKWHKVTATVQNLVKLVEEQESRMAELEAANTAAAARLAQQEAALERSQREQEAAVSSLSDSVRQLLQQGRTLLHGQQRGAPAGGNAGETAAAPAGAGAGAREALLDSSVEEFMEATSGCLQLHERRLDEIQSAVPSLQAAMREKALLAELQRQVSGLESTMAILTGGRAGGPHSASVISRPPPAMKCGPLSALPQLQAQVVALASEFDAMRAAMAAEVGRIRADAEADRADRADERERAAAAADAAARREAALRAEIAAREERILQIREAALSDDGVRQQLEELERALEAQVAELVAAQEATSRELRALQERVRELQAAPALASDGAHDGGAHVAPTASAKAAALSEQLAQALELARSASPFSAALKAAHAAAGEAAQEGGEGAVKGEEGAAAGDGAEGARAHANPFLQAAGRSLSQDAAAGAGEGEGGAAAERDDADDDVAARGGGADKDARDGAGRAADGASPLPRAVATPTGAAPQKAPAASGAASPTGDAAGGADDAAGQSDKPRRRKGMLGKRAARARAEAAKEGAEGDAEAAAQGGQPRCAPCAVM